MSHQRTRGRAVRVLGAGISLFLVTGSIVVLTAIPAVAQAAPDLTIENTSWHVYPWQKGNKSSLANRFPISARVCNSSDSATGPITVTMNHDLNPTVRITVEAASVVSATIAQQFLPSIPPPDPAKNETRVCRPVFFSFTATAQTTPSSSGQGAYTLTATDGTVTSNTTPSRTVWLQTMNQSNRNKMANTATAPAITHDMPCAAGTCTVRKGQSYNFVLRGAGPSGSSAQRQTYITFPANIFRVDKVTSNYSSHPTLNIDGIYADACGWNPATRKCVGPANISGGVIGGKVIRVKYKVTIIGTGSLSAGATGITGIIYDHNGSTYHVNGDSGTGGLQGTLTATTSADLRMNLSRTTTFQRGSTGSYALSITNNGSDPTSGNTTVTVTLPTGLTFNAAGTGAGVGWAATPCAAVGQTVTCTHSGILTPTGSPPSPVTSTDLTLGVNVASGAATTLTTTATAANSVADPVSSNNTASDLTVTAAASEADLVLTNSHVSDFSRGATGSYTLTVRNNGPAGAAGPLTVTDTLPAGLTYLSFTSGVPDEWDCSADGQTVTCTRSSGLPANTTAAIITLNVSVGETAAVSVTNTASVVANGTVDPYSPNNQDIADQTDIGSADLEARLWTTGQFAIPASGTTTGTVYMNFKNLGPDSATGPVTATVTLPTGLTYSSFSSDSASWTECSAAGQVVTCTREGSLATGATTSDVEVHVTIAAGTTEGVLDATATIAGPTSDPDPSNNTAEASVAMYFGVNLTVNTTASGTTSDGGKTTTVAAGTNITYTIVTTNNGPSTATDVYWIDTLPPGWTGTVGTITPGNGKSGTLDCDVDAATLTKPGEVYCNIGDISSGASVTSTIVIPTTTANPQLLVNTVLVDMTQANTATNGPPATQATTTLTGGNPAPVVAITSGPTTVGEHGTTQSNYAWTATDNSGTVSSVETSCGSGGVKVTSPAETIAGNNQSGNFNCTFPDGPTTSDVTIIAVDPSSVSGTATRTVTVDNVAPTGTFNVPETVTEAESFTLSVTDAIDVSSIDLADGLSFSFDCGDGYGEFGTTASVTCPGVAAGSNPVGVRIRDKDGGTTEYTDSISVVGSGPVITWDAGNDYSPAEDATTARTFNFNAADTDGLSSTVDASCGIGGVLVTDSATIDTDTGEGSFACLFSDGPTTPTISVTVTDGLANDTTDTQDVTVTNVAPIVTVTGDGAGVVGVAESFSYSITDPGNDTFPNSDPDDRTIACGTGGTVSSETATATGGTFECTYSSSGAKTVTVTVHDSDGAESSDTEAMTITANAGPIVTYTDESNSYTPTEDTAAERTFFYSATDVDGIPLQTPVIDCGSGGAVGANNFNVISGTGWFGCVFADGPAAPEVSVALDDSLGNTGSATHAVTVTNVAPTVTVTSDGAGAVGLSEALSYSITDPGDDTFPNTDPDDRTIECGTDGTASAETATATGGTFQCTYSSVGAKTVTVTVHDTDGAEGSDTEAMTITANAGPAITWDPGNGYSAAEHTTTALTFSFTAADTDGLSSTVDASCGTGGVLVTDSATIDTGTGAGSFACVFNDGPATPTISVTVTDDLGNDTIDTQGVTVTNVAPTVTVTGDGAGQVGVAESFSYSITDPGDDTFPNTDPDDRTIECGTSGTASDETATATGGTFQCTYSSVGTKTVTVTVHDDDGAEASDTAAMTITAPGPLVTSTDGAATTGGAVSPEDPLQAAVQSDADLLSELDGLGKGLEITLDKEDPTVTIEEDEHVQVDIQVEIHIREFDKDSGGAKIPGTEADYAADSYQRAFTFEFLIDGALIQPGVSKEEIRVYRTSGGSTIEVLDCHVSIDSNDDLPCMFERALDGDTGDVTLTIKTLGASLWNFVVPTAAADEPDPPSGGGGGGSPSPSPSISPTPEPTTSPLEPPPGPLVRIRVSDPTPRRGTMITIKTRLARCAGHEYTTIHLGRVIRDEWTKLGEKRLDGTCRASWRVAADFDERSFQTIWPQQDDDHRRGRSRIRTVIPHGRLPGPRIRLFVDHPTPVRGDAITFRTRLERCAGLEGDRVQLWRLVPGLTKSDASSDKKLLVMPDGVYRKLGTKRVDEKCHAEFKMTADFTTATFRTIWPKQDPRYRQGRAEPVVVRTRPA